MAQDFDAPRTNEDEPDESSIEELKHARTDTQSAAVDEDEAEAAEGFELPGADLSGEELMVRVLPAQEPLVARPSSGRSVRAAGPRPSILSTTWESRGRVRPGAWIHPRAACGRACGVSGPAAVLRDLC